MKLFKTKNTANEDGAHECCQGLQIESDSEKSEQPENSGCGCAHDAVRSDEMTNETSHGCC